MTLTVVRGIDPAGLDYTAGDTAFADTHNTDEPVFCNIPAVIPEMIRSVLQGLIASGGTSFIIGADASGTVTVKRSTGVGTSVGFLRWSSTNSKTEYSNDGSAWTAIDDTVSSVLVKVSSDDTTPGYLNGKAVAGDGIDFTENSPAGNETLGVSVDVSDLVGDGIEDDGSNNFRVALGAAGGLEFSGGDLQAKLKSGGGITMDSDGLSQSVVTYGGTAGEAIDGSATPQAVCVAGTTYRKNIRVESAADNLTWTAGAVVNMGDVDTAAQVAQSFTMTDAGAETITLEKVSMMIGKAAAPSDNVYIEIQGDDSNKPDKTPIANGMSAVIAAAALAAAASLNVQTFTFSTPPTIVSGTKYWIVFKRSAALDAVNYYTIQRTGSDLYASHGYSTYTASTTTWAAVAIHDFWFDARFIVNYNGQTFKADADNLSKCKFVGFTSSNVADAGTPAIQPSGVVTMSGLTPGATYFASATAGGITAAPNGSLDNCVIPVGVALSATELLITKTKKVAQYYFANIVTKTGSDSTTVDFFCETGFKPTNLRIAAMWLTGASTNVTGQLDYVYGTIAGGNILSALDSSSRTLTAASASTSYGGAIAQNGLGPNSTNYIRPITFYENGFDLRVVATTASFNPVSIYIVAEGY